MTATLATEPTKNSTGLTTPILTLNSVGMAFYSFSPALLWLWDEWSRQSSKYQPGVCSSKWATFAPNRISLGSIYYLAALDSYLPYSA